MEYHRFPARWTTTDTLLWWYTVGAIVFAPCLSTPTLSHAAFLMSGEIGGALFLLIGWGWLLRHAPIPQTRRDRLRHTMPPLLLGSLLLLGPLSTIAPAWARISTFLLQKVAWLTVALPLSLLLSTALYLWLPLIRRSPLPDRGIPTTDTLPGDTSPHDTPPLHPVTTLGLCGLALPAWIMVALGLFWAALAMITPSV